MSQAPLPALADSGGPFSSSRIRRALLDGYPERATEELVGGAEQRRREGGSRHVILTGYRRRSRLISIDFLRM